MRARRLLAAGVAGVAAKATAQIGHLPLLGDNVGVAAACGPEVAPFANNPTAMHNSNTPADYYGDVWLLYNTCNRTTAGKYVGFQCTVDSGCGWARVTNTSGTQKTCDSPLNASSCTTAYVNDVNPVHSAADAWFDSDISTPYTGKTGWF